jgi:hypothetical protein
MVEKIESLEFRKKGFASPEVRHRGRKSSKEKLRSQLMKHYGFELEDN